ncbi:hypothetical protein QEN19_003374 [Hanseniaspora menglaensis]
MTEIPTDITAELYQLRELESEIISLYFNTVSNYSKLNKNLAKKGGIDSAELTTTNYSNIIDLQLHIFAKLLQDFDQVEKMDEYKEMAQSLLDTLQAANQ